MKVKVCDMIMGAGKTESAITQMNEDIDSRYIFITPYLDEVDRIKISCEERRFKDPQSKGKGKLEDLHDLLRRRENIASTHALFRTYNEETMALIHDGGYKLILDEAFQAVQAIPVVPDDLQYIKSMSEIDSKGRVHWINKTYTGAFKDLKEMSDAGTLILHNDSFLFWEYPVEVFKAFHEVVILTYMFDAQIHRSYFDLNGVEYEKIGTKKENGVYRFSDEPCVPDYVYDLPNKIHIMEDRKMNKIGDDKTSLSASWYQKARSAKGRPRIRQLKNNLANFYWHKIHSPSEKNLWTTFKNYQGLLKGKGYTKGFLSCNARGTNAYRNRNCLAYCVNIYHNPIVRNYFSSQGVEIKDDEYALSEMVQWIWRSAIRDGEDIWLYIPSKRMRDLFVGWLEEISHGGKVNYINAAN